VRSYGVETKGGGGMEPELVILLSVMTVSAALMVGYVAKTRANKGKKITRVVEDSALQVIGDQVKEMGGTFKEMMEFKNKQIKSLQGQIGKFTQDQQQEDEDSGNNQVSFEDIQTLVSKTYPKYAHLLALPFAKKEIMKHTKGLSLEEVISVVEQFTGKKITDSLGSQQGINQPQDQSGYF